MANRYGPLVLKKLAKAQEILGYEFHDISWLREGLDITKPIGHIHAKNKRLALVGDHKIASVFIDRWYGKDDLFSVDWSEIRAANFSNQRFTEISYRNGLSNCTIPEAMLRLPGGKVPDSAVRIMSDTLEALLGAIYKDAKEHNHPDPYGEVEKAALRLGLADRRLMTPKELRWSVENLRTQRKLPPRMFTGHQLALASAIHELDRAPPSRPQDSQIHSLVYNRILEHVQAALVLREPLLAKVQQAKPRLRTLGLPKLKPLQARLSLHALGLQKLRPQFLLDHIWKQFANLRLWMHAAVRVFVDPFVMAYASIKTAFTPVPRHLKAKEMRTWPLLNLALYRKGKQSPAWNKIYLLSTRARGDSHRARKQYQQAWNNYKRRMSLIRLSIADGRHKLRDAVTRRTEYLVAIRTRIATAKANLRIGVMKKVKKSTKAKNRAIHALKRSRAQLTKKIRKLFQFKATIARYRATISRRLPRLFQRQAKATPVTTNAIQDVQAHNKVSKELESTAGPSVLSAQALEVMESKQTIENIKPTDDKMILGELRKVAKKTGKDMPTQEKKDERRMQEDATEMKEDQRRMQAEADLTLRLIGLHEARLHQAPDSHGEYDDTLDENKREEARAAKRDMKQPKKQAKKKAKPRKQEQQQVKKEVKDSAQEIPVKQLAEEYEAEQVGPQEQNVQLMPEEREIQAPQASLRSLAEQQPARLKKKQDKKTKQPETDIEQLQLEARKEVKSAQSNGMKQLDGEAKVIEPTETRIVKKEEKVSQVQPQRAIPVQAEEEAGTLAQAEEQGLQQTDEQAMRYVDDATLHITSTEDLSSQDQQVARLTLEPPPSSSSSSSSSSSPPESLETTKQLLELDSAPPIQSKPQTTDSGKHLIMPKSEVVHALIKQRTKALQARAPTSTMDMSRSVVKAAIKTELKLLNKPKSTESTKADKEAKNGTRGGGVMRSSATQQDSDQQHKEMASRVREVLTPRM